MEGLFLHISRCIHLARFGRNPEERSAKITLTKGCFEDIGKGSFWKAVCAEILGTMFLVLLICGSSLNVWDVTISSTYIGYIRISLTAGFAYASVMQMLGHVSGAHSNPIITFAYMISLNISIPRGVFYILAQCAGALAGSAILLGITPDASRGTLGATVPTQALMPVQGFAVELLMTFVFVYVHLASTDPNRNITGSRSVPVGLALTTAHLVSLPYTGCSVNPARSLGPAVIMAIWQTHWIYWAGPFSGALLAVVFYQIFNPYRQGLTMEETIKKLVNDGTFSLPLREYFERERKDQNPLQPRFNQRNTNNWPRHDFRESQYHVNTIYRPTSCQSLDTKLWRKADGMAFPDVDTSQQSDQRTIERSTIDRNTTEKVTSPFYRRMDRVTLRDNL